MVSEMAICAFSDFWLLSKVILMVDPEPGFVPDARGRSVDFGGVLREIFFICFACLVASFFWICWVFLLKSKKKTNVSKIKAEVSVCFSINFMSAYTFSQLLL